MDSEELSNLCSSLALEEDEETITPDLAASLQAQGERSIDRSLVGRVLSTSPIAKEAFLHMIKGVWKTKEPFEVESIGGNKFVFHFFSTVDKRRVFSGGPWCFQHKLLVLEEPTGVGDFSKMSFSKAPFWVQLHNIPIFCMNKTVGSILGNMVGMVQEVECDQNELCLGSFIRARVVLDVLTPLKRILKVRLGANKELVTILIRYEHLPELCFHCGILGHPLKECPERVALQGDNSKLKYGAWIRAPSPSSIATPLQAKRRRAFPGSPSQRPLPVGRHNGTQTPTESTPRPATHSHRSRQDNRVVPFHNLADHSHATIGRSPSTHTDRSPSHHTSVHMEDPPPTRHSFTSTEAKLWLARPSCSRSGEGGPSGITEPTNPTSRSAPPHEPALLPAMASFVNAQKHPPLIPSSRCKSKVNGVGLGPTASTLVEVPVAVTPTFLQSDLRPLSSSANRITLHPKVDCTESLCFVSAGKSDFSQPGFAPLVSSVGQSPQQATNPLDHFVEHSSASTDVDHHIFLNAEINKEFLATSYPAPHWSSSETASLNLLTGGPPKPLAFASTRSVSPPSSKVSRKKKTQRGSSVENRRNSRTKSGILSVSPSKSLLLGRSPKTAKRKNLFATSYLFSGKKSRDGLEFSKDSKQCIENIECTSDALEALPSSVGNGATLAEISVLPGTQGRRTS